ncbi:MAG TPA: carbohydrate kinase family protein [Candidatus Paceibacterota bacterium]|jgi:sugar/nucleoside kinase (ribokinase family)|nr:carbohydrate kinase family protein [Candidatus Paceibacterota bacterium]
MNCDSIVIGTATFDTFLKGFKYEIINSNVYANGKALAIAYGSKEKVEIIDHQAGGGAVNIALCLARLRLKTNIIIRICKDYEGDFILNTLKSQGNIFTNYIQFDRNIKTASSCVLVTGDGERTILSYKGCGQNLVIDSKILNKIKTHMLVASTIAGNSTNFQAIFEYKKQHPETILIANPGVADIEILRKHKE